MIRKKNLFDLFPYLGIALFTWFFLPPEKKGSVLYCLFCLGVGLSLYAVKHEYAKRFSKKGTEVTLSDAKRAGLYALTLDENEKAELASALGHDGAKIIFSPDGKIGWRDIASLTGGVYLLFGIPDKHLSDSSFRNEAWFSPYTRLSHEIPGGGKNHFLLQEE